MAKKHMSKSELLQLINRVKVAEKSREKCSYTGMATIANHLLWKEYHWDQEALSNYNQMVHHYYERYYNGQITKECLNSQLLDYAGFDVEFYESSVNDMGVPPGNKYLSSMAQRIVEADNDIYDMSQLYLLIHFHVLIDMGRSVSFLKQHKDRVNHKLSVSRGKVQLFHKELLDGPGIYIEIPT